jgi:16S rRNA (uracil1498-N3)-methyltransferase
MLYLYNEQAGTSSLQLEEDEHRYIFKVRRHKIDDTLYLRNLKDETIYEYLITHIDKKSTLLLLQNSQKLTIGAKKSLHIGWCVIEPKNIEKILPTLNEMGVKKITFIYCERSQKSFKLDFKRLHKILLNSSQQSGRSSMMILEEAKNLQTFLTNNPETKLLNFSKDNFISNSDIKTIVVGCEGGLTDEEVSLFEPQNILGFNTPLVLKSESAVCGVASRVLL